MSTKEAGKVEAKTEKREIRLFELDDELADLYDDIKNCVIIGRSLDTTPDNAKFFLARLSRLDSVLEKLLRAATEAKGLAKSLDRDVASYDKTKTDARKYFYEALIYERAANAIEFPVETPVDANSHSSSIPHSKLPVIDLPSFHGDLTEWLTFKDTFLSLVHDNKELTLVQKFHHLKSSLKGAAKQAIAHVPVTSANYNQAWVSLTSKYDNKRLLATNYLSKIFTFQPLTKSNLSSLDRLSEVVIESVAAFKALNLPDELGFVFAIFGLRLLDTKLREKFDNERRGNGTIPTFEDFIEFIHNERLSLQSETLLKCPSATSSDSNSTRRQPRNPKQVLLSQEGHAQPNHCPMCRSKHRLYHCPTFLTLKPPQRLERIKAAKLCINCLSPTHMLNRCASKESCRKCGKGHHTLLHFSEVFKTPHASPSNRSAPSVSRRDTPTTPPHKIITEPLPSTSKSSVLSSSSSSQNHVLLGTAVVRVKDRRGQLHSIRLVLDSGSQRSFITTSFAKKLGLDMNPNPQTLCGFGDSPIQGGKYQVECILYPKDKPYPELRASCIVVPQITCKMPLVPLPKSVQDPFQEYGLADPLFWKPSAIDFLLGADLFGSIFLGECLSISPELPNLVNTVFGWIVMGPYSSKGGPEDRVASLVSTCNFPDNTNLDSLPEIQASREPPPTILAATVKNPEENIEFLTRFSSYSRLLRVFSYMRRFINAARKRPRPRTAPDLSELRGGADYIIKLVQAQHFPSELLRSKNPQLQSLSPFVDSLGFVRVGGRLSNSPLPDEAKHPKLLPAKSHFTKLLVDYYHLAYLHAGPQLLHSLLQRRFWIVSARRVIRARVRQCPTCHRLRASHITPYMGDLPPSRFEQGRAFINAGVDFAGPFRTKEPRRRKPNLAKSYLALFVCLSTKAIHVEIVSQLSTEAFLAALDRFIARRGLPSKIYSDHGTNFVGASRHLRELYDWYASSDVQQTIRGHLQPAEIEWSLIPPSAPHFGGLWEAGVKSFKAHLLRVSKNLCLTFEELNTLATRIEAVLNSRPLYPISSSSQDYDVLTPGHFLIGDPLVTPPEHNLTDTATNRLSRWQLINRATQDIWNRWRFDYLNSLQQRVKWKEDGISLKVGDLVLLREPNVPPLSWPTGRISQVHPGKDGVVRVVTLKTGKGTYTRPATKLVPLLPTPQSED